MQEDQFWLLVSLQLSGEATPQELATLEDMLRANPEMGLQLEALHNLWQQPSPEPAARKTESLSRHLQRLSNHLSAPVLKYEEPAPEETEPQPVMEEPRRKQRWIGPLTGIAASLTAIFILLYQWSPKRRPIPVASAQNTISTKPGSKTRIQLPDGTQVWLNSDSRLVYDESFRGPLREVALQGEAYFDVARDKDHPFVIHTSSIDIKVLGTTLNIRSYGNEKKTETVLIGGSIEVTLLSSPDKKIVLKPNEKLVVSNGIAPVLYNTATPKRHEPQPPVMTLGMAHYRENDSTATDVLWTRNKLAFDQESLEDVALKLERWYDVKVIIADKSLRRTAYSAVFEDESLRQVMEALRLTGNFRYTINKKTVTITL
jgi:ferric-dicitrate binding protein FerR (iron transport regulator)